MTSEELVSLLKDFSYEGPGKEYLEKTITNLEQLKQKYQATSENPAEHPSHRAEARDKHQAITGLINGIKFSISFMQNRETL